MKNFFLLAIVLIIPAAHLVHADTLTAEKVSITGSIIQETGTDGATRILPITIQNILGVLGVTGTTAKDLSYYKDSTTESIVIAPKAAATSGTGTPVVTVGTPGEEVKWDPTAHSKVEAGALSAFNDDLSGSFYQTGVIGAKVKTDVVQFVASGDINGDPTIVKGTIVDVTKQ